MTNEINKIYPGQIYKHYKGGKYKVISISFSECNKHKFVVYQSLETMVTYHRPIDEFNAVLFQGSDLCQPCHRFTLIDDVDSIGATDNTDIQDLNMKIIDMQVHIDNLIEKKERLKEQNIELLEYQDKVDDLVLDLLHKVMFARNSDKFGFHDDANNEYFDILKIVGKFMSGEN